MRRIWKHFIILALVVAVVAPRGAIVAQSTAHWSATDSAAAIRVLGTLREELGVARRLHRDALPRNSRLRADAWEQVADDSLHAACGVRPPWAPSDARGARCLVVGVASRIRFLNERPAPIPPVEPVREPGQAATINPSPSAAKAEDVDSPVVPLDGPSPTYPQELRSQGIEGRVLLRFVVGTDGRVEASTIQVRSSSHPAFTAPAIEAIRKWRFRAARVGNSPTRQVVEQGVGFSLRDSQ